MQKTKLNKFIQKYNLGGNVNSVKWTSNTNKLTTSTLLTRPALPYSLAQNPFNPNTAISFGLV